MQSTGHEAMASCIYGANLALDMVLTSARSSNSCLSRPERHVDAFRCLSCRGQRQIDCDKSARIDEERVTGRGLHLYFFFVVNPLGKDT